MDVCNTQRNGFHDLHFISQCACSVIALFCRNQRSKPCLISYFYQTIAQINQVLDKLNKQRQEMESKYRTKIAELRPKEEQSKVQCIEILGTMAH